MSEAHEEVHHLVDPSCPSVLVPGRPDAGLAAGLGRVLPTQDLAHAREQRRGVQPPEAHLRGDLHEAQEPAGCEAEAQLPSLVQGTAEDPLPEAEALRVDVGLQGLRAGLDGSRTACGNPVLHHHDTRCKVEDQLVPHRLTGNLPRCHVLQDLPNTLCLGHGQLLRGPLQGAVGQYLKGGAEDDAQPAQRHGGGVEVGLAALDLADGAVVEHEGHGKEVLGVALPQVVAAGGYAAAQGVGGVAWRYTQRQATRQERVLQLAHLDAGLRLDLEGLAVGARFAPGTWRHHHLHLLEGDHVYNSPVLLVRRACEEVEAVTRRGRPHGGVLTDGCL
mmetsp:Transcript_29476/g.91905  ORF Transcript_29476/g.91905 Transcript_29476/m.91905 type:complete len:332 (-) Transcript_29476:163-1158(-)